MNLTQQQFVELKAFLATSPEEYGEWRIIPSCKFPTCVNSLGTMVIRFECSYVTSDGQHRDLNTVSYSLSDTMGYLSCYAGSMHRLVAEAFLDTWDISLEVNHKDGNKHNNNVTNLEMVSHEDNMNHFYTNSCFEDARAKWRQGISNGLAEHYSQHESPIIGKKWIHKDTESLLVLPDDIEFYLLQGYELGAYISEEHHQKIVNNNLGNSYAKGAVRTQEFKDNLAKRMKGNKYSEGYHHTEEAKRRISETHKGIPKSEETRRKLSEAKRGKSTGPMSDTTKSKIANFRRGKIWVHNITTGEMKQVTSEQLDKYLCSGFARGMK